MSQHTKLDKTILKALKLTFPEISNSVAEKLMKFETLEIDKNNTVTIKNEPLLRSLLLKANYYPNYPADKEISVVYEDDSTLLVNKPEGITVEPDIKDPGLVNLITYYINSVSKTPFAIPRPVHRLDKDTQGLVLFSKTLDAHRYYSKLFKEHNLRKIYTAKVKGKFDKNVPYKIETYISNSPLNRRYYSTNKEYGKIAQTIILDSKYDKKSTTSSLTVEILTGRTHQIRVHLSETGFPIIGDRIYGNENVLEKTKLGLKASTIELVLFGETAINKFSI